MVKAGKYQQQIAVGANMVVQIVGDLGRGCARIKVATDGCGCEWARSWSGQIHREDGSGQFLKEKDG